MTNTIKITFAVFWGYCFLNFVCLAYGIDKSRHRMEKLEQQVHILDSLNQIKQDSL